MRSVSLPPWGLALVIAASAPFVVRLFGESLSKRKKAKTASFLSRVRSGTGTSRQGREAEGSIGAELHSEALVADAVDPSGAEVRRTSWHD